MKFFRPAWIAGVLGSLLFCQLSEAYVPPAHFIFERMMKSREGLKSLELIAEVKDLQRNVVFQETLRLDFVGGRFWSVESEPAGALAASAFGKLSELKGLGQAWIEMGYDPSESRVKDVLQQHDVWPTEKSETRLVREGNKVLWAWGQKQELRVEKDQFVWSGIRDLDQGEVQVREQARFPRLILVRAKGQDRFQYTLKGFKINAPVKWNTSNLVPAQGALIEPVQEWMALVR